MGTRAGFLVAKGDHEVPTLSITATDPVAAGISKTTERSGLDHVHVQVEAGRIERHLAMFHGVIGFSSLGVPLDSTEAGMAVMGGLAIRQAAKEIGFEIVECRTGLELADFDKSFANLLGCLEILSLESDAVYLPVCNGLIEASASEGRMAELLAPMMSRGLPTFSQGGAAETRLGVLMSMAEEDFLNSGRFEAEVVRDVLAGRRPGDIGQVYLPPLTMALNLDTAEAIGWVPPFEVLAALDEIFTKARATAPDSGPGADAGAGPEALAKTIPQTAHSGGGGR
jgi:ABC-type uncharacterized transport system substrate-binding protein